MSKITPQSFSRNAENQIAAEVLKRADRFRKSKKGRLGQARVILLWAQELVKIVEKLNEEVQLPSPISPLAAPAARSATFQESGVLQAPAAGVRLRTHIGISTSCFDKALPSPEGG